MTVSGVLLALAAAAVAGGLVWRLASRRQSLPCPVWLRWMVELDNPFARVARAAEIVASLGLEPGMRVLDAGCGPGRVTVPLAQAVGATGEIVALDMQAGMLSRAEEKTRGAGLGNVRFLQAGLGAGALPRAQFDRAILVTVLGEIPDRHAAMAELFAALKPGGLLSVTEMVFDPHFQGRATVTALAEAAGFRPGAFFGNRIAFTLHLEKPRGG